MELKVRIWATTDEGEEMIYLGKQECDNGLWFNSEKHINEYHNVMLFSGIHDRDGKEIYIGDIIDTHPFHKLQHNCKKEKRYQEVIFINGEFTTKHSSFGYEGEDLITLEQCAVVGNIHQSQKYA